jgi:hypothetical protein
MAAIMRGTWMTNTGTGPVYQVRMAAMSVSGADTGQVQIDEAARQLELAIHDARVAFDCIELGELDRAHTSAITARAAADAAETLLRAALGEGTGAPGDS